jgi:uncharacterized protein
MKKQLDLSARMAVCDANYLRLLKLIPDFSVGYVRTILLPPVKATTTNAMQRMEIRVTESFRYTATVSVQLALTEAMPAWYRAPQLVVRVYHDAETAEVLSYQDQQRFKAFYSEDEAPNFYWDEKNQVNVFLAEWLMLSIEGGMSAITLPACLQSTATDGSTVLSNLGA